jgi:ribosomal protein S18 acetylase RimI-like enzyme
VGYNEIILDTSTKLEAAIHLYKEFGFSEIPAYYHNPHEDVIYMSLDLSKTNHR